MTLLHLITFLIVAAVVLSPMIIMFVWAHRRQKRHENILRRLNEGSQ